MDIVIEKLAERLHEVFYGKRGYITTPTGKKRADGKEIHDTRSVKEELEKRHYYDHLTTKKGLTVSPFFELDKVFWGSLDIDKYSLTNKQLIRIIIQCRSINLVPTRSKSGGLHLWAFCSKEVPAWLMIKRLMCARDELGLDPKTELFPKQKEIKEGQIGNGITIPYRGRYTKDYNFNTVLLEVENEEIKEKDVGAFLSKAEKFTEGYYNYEWHKKWEDYVDIVQHTEKISAKENKLTKKQILEAIKNKEEHSKGGTFDNWITLYVAKAVREMQTDDDIISALDKVSDMTDKASDENYYQNKIDYCRKRFGIDDPAVAKEKILNNLVYVKSAD